MTPTPTSGLQAESATSVIPEGPAELETPIYFIRACALKAVTLSVSSLSASLQEGEVFVHAADWGLGVG